MISQLQPRILRQLILIPLLVFTCIVGFVLAYFFYLNQQIEITKQMAVNTQQVAASMTQLWKNPAIELKQISKLHQLQKEHIASLAQEEENFLLALAVPQDQFALQKEAAVIRLYAEKINPKIEALIQQDSWMKHPAESLHAIQHYTGDMLVMAELVAIDKIEKKAAAREINAANELIKLSQNLKKTASDLLSKEGYLVTSAVVQFAKELSVDKELMQSLRNINFDNQQRLFSNNASLDDPTTFLRKYEEIVVQTIAIHKHAANITLVQGLQQTLSSDLNLMLQNFSGIQSHLSVKAQIQTPVYFILSLLGFLILMTSSLCYWLGHKGQKYLLKPLVETEQTKYEDSANDEAFSDLNDSNLSDLKSELADPGKSSAKVYEDVFIHSKDSKDASLEVVKISTQSLQTAKSLQESFKQFMASSSHQLIEIHQTIQAAKSMSQRLAVAREATEATLILIQEVLALPASQASNHPTEKPTDIDDLKDQLAAAIKKILLAIAAEIRETNAMTDVMQDIFSKTELNQEDVKNSVYQIHLLSSQLEQLKSAVTA